VGLLLASRPETGKVREQVPEPTDPGTCSLFLFKYPQTREGKKYKYRAKKMKYCRYKKGRR